MSGCGPFDKQPDSVLVAVFDRQGETPWPLGALGRHHQGMEVHLTSDPDKVASAAGSFLRAGPVERNLLMTLIADRSDGSDPEPGLYGWVEAGGEVVGVYFHSPARQQAVVSSMPSDAVEQLVRAVARREPALPGVLADAATAAGFAGAWAEVVGVPVVPVEARRLYRLSEFIEPQPTEGGVRLAIEDDHELVAQLRQDMVAAIGTQQAREDDHHAFARRVLASKRLWLWDNRGEVTCMVAATEPVVDVARVFGVYTPPEHRGRGYATACTAAATQALLDEGSTPVLYTQLSNPTSNGIYRRLGYRPVSELLIYRFGDAAIGQPAERHEPSQGA